VLSRGEVTLDSIIVPETVRVRAHDRIEDLEDVFDR